MKEQYYNVLARIKYWISLVEKALDSKKRNSIDFYKLLMDFSKAKSDVLAYYDIDESTYWKLVNEWPDIEEKLFLEKESIDNFYHSWSGTPAQANICANVYHQFVSAEQWAYIGKYINQAKRVLDFGCGTATVTLSHLASMDTRPECILYELQSEVREFIDYRAELLALDNVKTEGLGQLEKLGTFDFVMCNDVLEHLENPSEVLISQILPKVEVGGLLMLRAPWRGQLTHIEAAPLDFYNNGGREVLAKHFAEVERFNSLDVCAVYKRVK